MGYLELALIGVGLSMDAFAVSVCKGLSMRKVDKKYMFVLAAFFGGFQALMPALGWLLGSQFQSYITAIDHWMWSKKKEKMKKSVRRVACGSI